MKKIKIDYTSSRDTKQKNQPLEINQEIGQQSLGENSPMRKKTRPISPHLQIYKFEWTMAYSITHRISAVGVGIICYAIILLNMFIPLYDLFNNNIIIKIIYAGGLFCIGYYIFATIKYMFWAKTMYLDLKNAKILGHLSLLLAILFTVGGMCNVLYS